MHISLLCWSNCKRYNHEQGITKFSEVQDWKEPGMSSVNNSKVNQRARIFMQLLACVGRENLKCITRSYWLPAQSSEVRSIVKFPHALNLLRSWGGPRCKRTRATIDCNKIEIIIAFTESIEPLVLIQQSKTHSFNGRRLSGNHCML